MAKRILRKAKNKRAHCCATLGFALFSYLFQLTLFHSHAWAVPGAELSVSSTDNAHTINYAIHPTEDVTGCTYALFVDHRRPRIKDIPAHGIRVASFTRLEPEVLLISEEIDALHFPRAQWKTESSYRRIYFRLLLTCQGEYGYSNIASLLVKRTKQGGVRTPQEWALLIRNNIRYADR